jgi:hypothetical protein
MNRWGRRGLGLTQLREATRGLPNRLLLTAAVLCLLALLLLSASTFSAFSGATGNPANTLSAGTVSLTDNDAGAAMFALGNLKPGDTDSGCLQVTYTGSLPALVRLSGTTTGTGLDQYVDLKVTRGTIGSGSFDDCTGFTPTPPTTLGKVPASSTTAPWPRSPTTGPPGWPTRRRGPPARATPTSSRPPWPTPTPPKGAASPRRSPGRPATWPPGSSPSWPGPPAA